MTDKDLRSHQKKMLAFCAERNLAIDDIIARIERYVDDGQKEGPLPRIANHNSVAKGTRLLIEALDVIKKLTGK